MFPYFSVTARCPLQFERRLCVLWEGIKFDRVQKSLKCLQRSKDTARSVIHGRRLLGRLCGGSSSLKLKSASRDDSSSRRIDNTKCSEGGTARREPSEGMDGAPRLHTFSSRVHFVPRRCASARKLWKLEASDALHKTIAPSLVGPPLHSIERLHITACSSQT